MFQDKFKILSIKKSQLKTYGATDGIIPTKHYVYINMCKSTYLFIPELLSLPFYCFSTLQKFQGEKKILKNKSHVI